MDLLLKTMFKKILDKLDQLQKKNVFSVFFYVLYRGVIVVKKIKRIISMNVVAFDTGIRELR